MHDSCDCDMCVDEKHVVKMMKHLLMIQKLMLIKLMLMKLMLTTHMLINTMWINVMFKYVDEIHVDRNHVDTNHVDRNHVDKNHVDKNHVDKKLFDRTGVLNMLSTPLATDRTGVRSVAGSDFIYNVTKNSARPRFDFNMCTRGANSSRKNIPLVWCPTSVCERILKLPKFVVH